VAFSVIRPAAGDCESASAGSGRGPFAEVPRRPSSRWPPLRRSAGTYPSSRWPA